MKQELRREPVRDDRVYKGVKIERWRAFFEFYDENGKLQRFKPSCRTEKLAKQKIKDFEREETTKRKFVKPGDKVRFADYAEKRYKPAMLKRLSPTSHVGEVARVDAAIEFFGNATIESITRLRVKDYKAHLEQKTANGKETRLSITTVDRYLQRLRAVLNEAQADYPELPPVNFAKGIIETSREIKRERTINYTEFDKLLNACTGRQASLKLYLIALWETGARCGEIKGNKDNPDFLPGVKRSDIDLDKQTIELWNSKLHPGREPEQRTAYLSEYFRDALIAAGIDNLEPEALVFNIGDVKKGWTIIKKRAKLDEAERPKDKNSGVFLQKDVRHCFTNNSDDAGVQKTVIAHQINHNADSDLLGNVYIHQRA